MIQSLGDALQEHRTTSSTNGQLPNPIELAKMTMETLKERYWGGGRLGSHRMFFCLKFVFTIYYFFCFDVYLILVSSTYLSIYLSINLCFTSPHTRNICERLNVVRWPSFVLKLAQKVSEPPLSISAAFFFKYIKHIDTHVHTTFSFQLTF
jgi:hypothetical protein